MIQPLVALDLGSTKVACAIGLPHEQAPGFTLMGSSLIPYAALSGLWSADPLMVSRTIEQALEATAVSAHVQRALVAFNHPTLTSEIVQAILPLADEPVSIRAQDVDRLRRRALDQGVGLDREPLVVECLGCSGNGFEGIRDPQGLPATRLRGAFHIVTMPVALRRAVVQAVEGAGLEIAQLSSTLPAVFSSMAEEAHGRARVLLIDVGGCSTDVGLFVDGAWCAAAILPWGGLTLATELATTLRVTMDQATAWSLEGTSCRRAPVREVIERQWASIPAAIEGLLTNQPQPDATLLTGRGALIDGLAEWIERRTHLPVTLCRSPRTSALSDLSRQLGLSAALGLLEQATGTVRRTPPPSPHALNRLIHRTKALLTEYF